MIIFYTERKLAATPVKLHEMAPKDRTLLSFFKKKDTSSASSSPTPARSSQSQHASNSSSPAPSASSVSKKRPPIQIEASSDVEPDPITGTTPQTVSSKKPRLSPINGQSETPASDTSDAPQGSSVLRKVSAHGSLIVMFI